MRMGFPVLVQQGNSIWVLSPRHMLLHCLSCSGSVGRRHSSPWAYELAGGMWHLSLSAGYLLTGTANQILLCRSNWESICWSHRISNGMVWQAGKEKWWRSALEHRAGSWAVAEPLRSSARLPCECRNTKPRKWNLSLNEQEIWSPRVSPPILLHSQVLLESSHSPCAVPALICRTMAL